MTSSTKVLSTLNNTAVKKLQSDSKNEITFSSSNQFHIIREEKHFFYDRSLLLAKILEHRSNIGLSFSSGFGKSVNLSMLRCFLAACVEGIQTKNLFKGLEIESHSICSRYQGKYPVIYFDFSDLKANNHLDLLNYFFQMLEKIIREQIASLSYTSKSSELYAFLNQKLKELHELHTKNKDCYEHDLIWFMRKFIIAIGKQLKTRVFVLIDGADIPLTTALQKGHTREANSFLSGFMVSFKDNTTIESLVFTQTYQVVNAVPFCLYSNFSSNHPINKYFGATQKEMTDLAKSDDQINQIESLFSYSGMYSFRDIQRFFAGKPLNFPGITFIDAHIEQSETLLLYSAVESTYSQARRFCFQNYFLAWNNNKMPKCNFDSASDLLKMWVESNYMLAETTTAEKEADSKHFFPNRSKQFIWANQRALKYLKTNIMHTRRYKLAAFNILINQAHYPKISLLMPLSTLISSFFSKRDCAFIMGVSKKIKSQCDDQIEEEYKKIQNQRPDFKI